MKRWLILALFAGIAAAQQTNSDFIPATTGLNLGRSNQRWNGFFNNLNITGTCTFNGGSCFTGGSGPGSPFVAGGDLSGVNGNQKVVGLLNVPFCTGYSSIVTGQVPQFTTSSSPNPCYTPLTIVGGGNVSNSGTPAATQVGIWIGPTSLKGEAAFLDLATGGSNNGPTLLYSGGNFNSAFLGQGNQAACNVDPVTGGSNNSTIQQCSNYFENVIGGVGANNGLRSGLIIARPEIMNSNPFKKNFSVDLRVGTGGTNSTTCDDSGSNTNCLVAKFPMIFGASALTIGAGPVLNGQNMSQGSLIKTSSLWPAPVGKPTFPTVTCTGTGGSGGLIHLSEQMIVNLESLGGNTAYPGPSAYTTQDVNCGGVTSAITIPVPTGGNAGSLTKVDFRVGVASALNGDYYVQQPGVSLTCGSAGTVDATNDCLISGGAATLSIAAIQTAATSFPMAADNKTGQPVDISNPLIVMGNNATVSFLEQFRDIAIACPDTGHGVNNPNVLIYNINGQEGAGSNNGTVQIYGDCGGYSGISGAFIYSASQTPNSTWSQLSISGGPKTGSAAFYGIICDGRPNGVGGASGCAREISNNTIAIGKGVGFTATGSIPLLFQGFRTNTKVTSGHYESTSGNEAAYITNGAHVTLPGPEGATTGSGFHFSTTAGFSSAMGICPQGTANAASERCQSGSIAIQDDSAGGAGSLTGYQAFWASGGSNTTVGNFLATGTFTVSSLTGGPFCVQETSGVFSTTGAPCGAGDGGFTNPMTTPGDLIVGTTAGAALRMAVNATSVPQVVTSVSGVTSLQSPGVPVDATNPATLLSTDRANYLNWTSGTALALPAISGAFASSFPFVLKNTSTTLTITPNAGVSDMIDGSATGTIIPNFASFVYQDGTSAPGHWFTVKFPTFAAFGSTCTTLQTWSTTTGFTCVAAVNATQVNGATVPASANLAGTNSSNQIIQATGLSIGSDLLCSDSSALSTAQVCNTSPTFAPVTGSCVNYTTTTQNTSSLTVNVNSLGPVAVKKWLGAALVLGDLPANKMVPLCYDGTNWQIQNTGLVTGTGAVVNAISPALQGSPTAPTQSQNDNSTKVSTTAYADLAVANGIAGSNPAIAVLAASTANLTGTYSNGASGIGATFTVTATGAFTLDGVSIGTIGQRVLLKNQSSGFQNGMYTATVVGSIGVSPIFTRALDYDAPSDINTTGAIPVQSGTVNADTSWLLTSTVTTVGTDALTYIQFTINPSTLVTSAASLTSTAFMTGAGSQGSQTPSATSTLSAGGNASFAGTLTCAAATCLGSDTATTQSAKDNSTKVATTAYVDAATGLTTGTSVTLTASRQYFVCTGTCTITVPVPAAGYEFCVMNDDNVATVITLSAIGSSSRYENTARTAYGTAGTGTFVSGGAVGDKVCLLGRDSTHYLTASFNGSWTAN